MTFSFVPACRTPTVTHGGLRGGNLARHDRLQPQNGRGRHDDRIDAGLRHRAVRAAPEQADLQAVRRRRDRPGAPGDGARRSDHDMLAQHDVGLGKALDETVVDHCPRALRRFFAGLENSTISVPCQASRLRANKALAPISHATCMSWPQACATGTVLPDGVGRRHRAGIVEPGRLLDRQRIHVGAQHDRRAPHRCASRPTTPVFPTPVVTSKPAARAVAAMPAVRVSCIDKFGMGVHVLIKRFKIGKQLVQVLQDNGALLRGWCRAIMTSFNVARSEYTTLEDTAGSANPPQGDGV